MKSYRSYKSRIPISLALVLGLTFWSCEREPRVSASYGTIEERYGLTSTFSETIRTDDGTVTATVVPITLSDGRHAEIVIPKNQLGGHRVFLRDTSGLSPVVLENPRMSRDEFVRSQPRVVERRTEVTTPQRKRSWQKEALIIGGSSGAGAAISGGVEGLIYDLATRNK